jgi:uncharacterized membrane protein
MPKQQFKIKPILFGIVIAIVLSSFVLYAIETAYPSPEYKDYCEERMRIATPEKTENMTQEICEQEGGAWNNNYCDYYTECQEEYDQSSDNYKRTIFFITLGIGLIFVIAGVFVSALNLSLGALLSGIFLTFYSVVISWTNLSNVIRTITLGIVLVILIWVGYKKLEN